MAISVGGVSFDLGINLNKFEKQLDKAFGIAKKKGAGLVWDTSSFVAGLKMTKKEFQAFGREVEKAKDKYAELIDLQKGLQDSGIWDQLGDEARSAVEEAAGAAKEQADIYDRTLKHMGRAQRLKSIFGGVKKIFGGLFSIFRKHTAKAGADFGGFLKKLLGIAGVAALLKKAFGYAREGMQNLVQADATTANSVNSLRGALAALKNAFAAAFAPILNVVAPILTKFIGMLTTAANAIASFLSALTGRKFAVVASTVSDGFGGIGDSAGSANDSAKELQRTLMGFDKINKLDSNSGSGSGGGGGAGGGGGGGGGFDLVPISDEVNAWADKFRESWENADFEWLGELLAEKINGALEKIDWGKINATLEKIAKSIGTFLNGFIRNLNWNLLGETLGEGIKAALNFLNTFFETVDWGAIGEAIVEFLTGIDWIGIFKGAGRLMKNIADALYEMVLGALEKAKEKLGDTDIWETLTSLKDENLKISAEIEFISVLPDWLESVLNFAFEHSPMSLTLDVVGKVSEKVQTVIKFWNKIKSGAKKKLTLLAYKKGNLKDKFVKTVANAWEKLSKLKKSIKLSLRSSGITSKLASAVERVKNAWNAIKSGTKTITLSFADKFRNAWSSLKTWLRNNAPGWLLNLVGLKNGGILKGSSWKPITAAAKGGSFGQGQMFIARENGPELVGTLGGHTAVMNNDQIVASVSAGVARAIAGLKFRMSAPPLAMMSGSGSAATAMREPDNQAIVNTLLQILTALNNKKLEVNLDGEELKNSVVRRINNHTRQTGRLEIIM